jgi:hypothetical protein
VAGEPSVETQHSQLVGVFDRPNTRHYRTVTMDHAALIFLHIPKTAGTTLNRIIEWQYPPLSIFNVDARAHATVERFKTLSEERRRRFRVVRGHMGYGIHEFLPQGGTYITMLREPVARVLSSYYFILRRPLHPHHRKLKKNQLGIEEYLRLFPDRDNVQCRFVAGVQDGASYDDHILEIAKENLTKSFSVIGLSERFEESLVLLAKTFGWEIPYFENWKVAKVRPAIDPRVIDRIRERNHLDIQLYDFAKARFEESLRRKGDAVRNGLTTLHSRPRPGPLKNFCDSGLSMGRFLVSKIASAI